MSKYLVTGASGFIGKEIINQLLLQGHQVVAIYRKLPLYHEKIFSLTEIECEMNEYSNLINLLKDKNIDACIHLAWSGSTGNERADYKLQLGNVKNTLVLISTLAELGIKRFVGAGSLAEMDVQNYHPLDGTTPNVVSHYGVAKMALHYMSKSECTKNGIEHIWCYIANTYGEGNRTENFVNFAARLMLSGKRASFTKGEQMYDFAYIKDTTRGIISATISGRNNYSYYIGSGKQRKLKEYIRIIRDNINSEIELYLGEIPFSGAPLPDELYDISKLQKDTGFFPAYSFEETIGSTIKWLKGETD
jgi:UDP-glucose 4-epimerase